MLRSPGNLTTNHTKTTNFLFEILFFIRDVGVGRPSVCRGKFSFFSKALRNMSDYEVI
jgi:hypothetical protein